jgi:hypothetical protein
VKCISLWQPWASAIAAGSKLIETRSWPTRYRGPLLIHAARRLNRGELMHLCSCWNWKGAMAPVIPLRESYPAWELLPFGAVIAVADLMACRPTDSFTVAELDSARRPAGERPTLYDWTERHMGDFSPGRFGWVLSNVRAFKTPIPFRGRQQLFDVPDELVRQQIEEARR